MPAPHISNYEKMLAVYFVTFLDKKTDFSTK
jgi:hypothetical protein